MTPAEASMPCKVVVVGDPSLAEAVAASCDAAPVRVNDYLHAIGELSRGGVVAVVGRGEPMTGEVESTTRALRAAAGGARLLLVTDPSGEPQAQRAVRLGFDDYLIEPMRSGELAEAIGRGRVADTHPFGGVSCDGSLIEAVLDPRINVPRLLAQRLSAELGGAVSIAGAQTNGAPGAAITWRGRTIGRLVSHTVDPSSLTKAADRIAGWLALSTQHDRYRLEAQHDELTSAWNRRYFDRFFDQALARAAEQRFRVTLMLYDIDDFKVYNDRYGHAAGDEILQQTATLMRSVVRKHDIVARVGGDEFAVLFWDADEPRKRHSEHPDNIAAVARRFQKAVCEHRFPKLADLAPGTLTISGGLASFPWDGKTRVELMAIADQMLLRSKGQGKNALTFGPGALRACEVEFPNERSGDG